MNGVTFNGVHSSTFDGLMYVRARRPLIAENKDVYIDMPHKDGSILIPDKSKKDILVEVDFSLVRSNVEDLFNTGLQIGAWLSTDDRAPLIFDDVPSYTYSGKVISSLTLEQLVDFDEIADFTVVFRCLPEAVTG